MSSSDGETRWSSGNDTSFPATQDIRRFYAPIAPGAPPSEAPGRRRDAYDAVVVGAGVSGLYAALQLAQRGQRVLVLERQRRVGGRVLTERVLGHTLEYGPMRFEPQLQPRFARLVCNELGLCCTTFAPYTCCADLPDLNKVAPEEVAVIHAARGVLAPAFALLAHALGCVLGEQWDVAHDDAASPGRDARKAWLRRHGTFQGRPLWAHGLWDTLAHVLSKAALDFLQQRGTFYHILHLNPNAADSISFMLDVLVTARASLVSVEGGFQRVVDALMARLVEQPSAHIRLGAAVAELCCTAPGKPVAVKVLLEDGSRISARRVLLTGQQARVQALRGMPSELQPLLASVMLVRLFKIFAILEDPPFDDVTVPQPNFGADKLPCREIHYSYCCETKTGMVMIYGDEPSLHYWSPFVRRCDAGDEGAAQSNANSHLKHHLNFYLRAIFGWSPLGAAAPFSIVHYGILDWSCDSTGVHQWRPGFCSEAVMSRLAQGARSVHVCGETYSTCQGFIEGGLRAVDAALASFDV